MEPAAAAAGDGPPTACAPPGEHPAQAAQLAAKLAAGAHALCSMAEAAAAAAAEQQSEGETFDHQRTASGEQEAEGSPVQEPDSGADGSARACSQCGQTRTTTWRRHPMSRDWACNSCEWLRAGPLPRPGAGAMVGVQRSVFTSCAHQTCCGRRPALNTR